MLLYIPDILDQDEVAAMRQQLMASHDWQDGRQTVGSQGAQVKRNLQLAEQSPLAQKLSQRVYQALYDNKLFFAAALPLRMLPPRFNLYQGGGTYGMHVDGAVMNLPNQQQLRSDLSCTLFFNNPEDYDGGELIIADTYGEHEVKLPAGDLILYPSSSLHSVTPVTRGSRLGAIAWIQSMVRDNTQRRTLFELDTAITRLTETQADRAAVLQVTSVYHNLLRQWSEI